MLTSLPVLAGSLHPVKLRVGGKEVALKSPALYDGREVYLPLDSLRAFNASYRTTHRDETAYVTFEDTTVEFALARPGRQPMLPLSAVAGFLKSEFTVQNGVCEVRPRGSHLEPKAQPDDSRDGDDADDHAAPPPPTIQKAAAPPRSKEPVKPANSEKARPQGAATQNSKVGANTGTQKQTSVQHVDAQRPSDPDDEKDGQDGNGDGQAAKPAQPAPSTPAPVVTKPAKPAPAPLRILAVAFEASDAYHAMVKVRTSGKVAASARLTSEPSRLVIDVPNCVFQEDTADWPIDHPFLSAIHAGAGGDPHSTRVILDLQRMVSYRIVDVGPEGFAVALGLPRNAGRKLSSMIIVVDPGHGGSSTGCSWPVDGHRVYEKNITLSIGMKLRELLAEAGANVVITRTKDFDPGLTNRPKIANEANADLFVSIHVDDCPGSTTASGSTAYYHMDDSSSRALAQSVVGHIARVSGLPSRGAKSDRIRFQNGMAVLRYAQMPATLVEVGYISTASNRRKLLDDEWRQTVAQAIFDGIKGYVEGSLPETARVTMSQK